MALFIFHVVLYTHWCPLVGLCLYISQTVEVVLDICVVFSLSFSLAFCVGVFILFADFIFFYYTFILFMTQYAAVPC